MKRIQLLDKKIYDKIAAGEIVESPVSVVKELLENALDAGATQIEIDLENAGMSLIRVMDNGSGIHPEDLEKAFQSHATSKISNEEDLDNIRTFGFRGEALASISAVSHMEMISRTSQYSSGTLIQLDEGRVYRKEPRAFHQGTRVEVRNLFFNLPARKKFITNLNQESGKVSELVSHYALGHPETTFVLRKDKELQLDTRGQQGLEKRIAMLWGRKKEDFFLIEGRTEMFSCDGVLFLPGFSKNNRKSQVFFVNGRLIRSLLLQQVVEEAYESLIPKGRFPMAMISLEISPALLDVNIHPAKTEIRFLDTPALRSQLLPFLRKGILAHISEPAITRISDFPSYPPPQKVVQPTLKEYVVRENTSIEVPIVPSDKKEAVANQRILAEAVSEYGSPNPLLEKREDFFSEIRVIGQFQKTFILAEMDKDLYIIDQHVVHERILYEKFMEMADNSTVVKEELLYPQTLTMTDQEETLLIQHILLLNQLGFTLEHFGPRTYLLRSVPQGFLSDNMEQFFLDLLETLSQNTSWSQGKLREEILITAACKASVKAREILTPDKIYYLLKQLAACKNPHTCPHGRPVFKKITLQELYTYFQRGGV